MKSVSCSLGISTPMEYRVGTHQPDAKNLYVPGSGDYLGMTLGTAKEFFPSIPEIKEYVADLRPAVVPGNFRGGIGVDHGHYLPGSAQGYASHYAISFIMLCMNATSSEVSLYFENSSSSVHALEKS